MKRLSLIALVLLYVLLTFYYFNRPIISYAKTSNNLGTENKIDKIDEKDRIKIKIYFPVTDYSKLNKVIRSNISTYIKMFKNSAKDNSSINNQYNELYILYDEYKYNDIISYVFNIEMYTGGAHPSHYIKTINYDIDNNKIIDIDTLISNDDDILNKLSLNSQKILNKRADYDEDMIKEGTIPNKINFSNFIFTTEGLKVYFSYYQVAPYSYGSVDITIPYKDINLKMSS